MGRCAVEIMARTAQEFGGVEHRMELVRELGGVKWYNDSIGTSPTRTIAGLKAFGQKIILIAGGYDKKIPYEPLAPYLCEKVSHLILMGATGPKIQQALEACPDYDGSIRHCTGPNQWSRRYRPRTVWQAAATL